MGGTAVTGKGAFAVEEARLAHAAAAGEGSAFAALYERYEQRAYNIAHRVTGSESDAADATQEAFLRVMRRVQRPQEGELAFGSSLFTATRNACYDLMRKRPPAEPSVLEPEQDEVGEANMRLPEHQREALALRELAELSYDEIAAIMEMNRDSVAQLIFRARINLRDELHGTALATVAAPSPECERALRLIAAREDGQIDAGSDDDAWLDAHLAGCERCGLAVEAMRRAGASYRTWAPIAVVPWLLEDTMAKAAMLADADWSEAIAGALAARADPRSPSGQPPAHLSGRDGEDRPSRRRGAVLVAGLAALLLGGGVATVLAGGERSPVADRPAAATHPTGGAPASKPRKKRRGHREAPRKEASASRAETTAPATTATPAPAAPPTEAGESAPSEPATPAADQQGAAGLQPPRTIATQKPKATPKPTQTPTPTPDLPSQPPPAAAPTTEAQPLPAPPTEDPPPEHPSKGRGPPAGVPSRGGS